MILKNITWFFRRVKRVVDFLPIIWKGYDFDYRHALDLFHYQLTRTADFLDSDRAYSVRAKQDARRLRTILELMTKVYDEEYRMAHFDQMERFWGEMDMSWKDNNDGTSRFVGWKWQFAHTPEQQERAERQFSALTYDAEKKHQRAKKLLWKLIEHNLEHMWD
jgi:hypothetical protein